jgi:phosphoglycolate phosphatase
MWRIMKYKLIIFDFDGTLADTLPFFMSQVNALADKHKFKHMEENELELLRTMDAKQIMKHLKVPAWKLPLIGRDYRKLLAKNISQVKLFEGVETLLEKLSEKGITLAIVSSNADKNVRRILGPVHEVLIRYFACGAAMFGKHTQIKKIVEQSAIPATATIYIGDEIRDVEAAKKAGVDFGGVGWGYTQAEALKSQADISLFNSVAEMLAAICSI